MADDPRVRVIAGAPPPGLGRQALGLLAGGAGGARRLAAVHRCRRGPRPRVARPLRDAGAAAGHAAASPWCHASRRRGRRADRAAGGVRAIATFVAPGPLARSRRSPVAMAAGGFILVDRVLYDRVGGHRRIADRMIDDVSLAEAREAGGGLLMPVDGDAHGVDPPVPRRRARCGPAGARTPRSASPADRRRRRSGRWPRSPWLAALPPVALRAGPAAARRRRSPSSAASAGAMRGGPPAHGDRAARPRRARYAPTMPLGMLVFMGAAALRSAADRMRGGPIWRGRRYPARAEARAQRRRRRPAGSRARR